MNPPALVVGGLLVVGLFSGLWLVSLRARDVSLVDRLWGPAFALLAGRGERRIGGFQLLLQPLPALTVATGLGRGLRLLQLLQGAEQGRQGCGEAVEPLLAAGEIAIDLGDAAAELLAPLQQDRKSTRLNSSHRT